MEQVQPIIEKAQLKDIPFLVKCIIDAERAHTGKGFWDCMLPEDLQDKLPKILAYMVENDNNAFFQYSRFSVIRDENTGNAVSGLCAFMFPEFSLDKLKPGLYKALDVILNNGENTKVYTETDFDGFYENINFVGSGFPDNCGPYYVANTWLLESVYTESSHRGRGYMGKLLNHVIEQGKQTSQALKLIPDSIPCKECVICVAIGNDPAVSVYKRVGFEMVGSGNSELCMNNLGSPGFHVLHKTIET